ncbi:MAG: NnrS family protein [Rhodobacteraceae bacterium]|nr:NnrS family protein [Paracoccaceae bacterium]MCW9042032.1 NnrS family protein [Pseudopelagicola sp.]
MIVATRLFSAGFRIFFLAAGLFAVLGMIVWEGWLAIHAAGGMVSDMPFYMPPHLWHAHEMVFGYGSAVVAGFLLTAAPNWTGTKLGSVPFFAALSALWVAGRLAILWSGSLPVLVVALCDLVFLPVLAARILQMLLKRPKPQQLVLFAVIMIYWAGNVLVHLEWAGVLDNGVWYGLRAGLVAVSGLILILGGRVTPAFTRNAILRTGQETGLPKDPEWLARPAVLAALLAPVGILLGLPDAVWAVPLLLAGGFGIARLTGWRGRWTLGQPILWTLHLSYFMNAFGMVLLGLATLGFGSEVAALHVLAIGGVGGMTLSIMTRASLGHTGRALVVQGEVVLAYTLIPLAALARFVASALPEYYYAGVLISGGLWITAFALFCMAFLPVLLGPRVSRA